MSSFGPSSTTQSGENTVQNTNNTATANSAAQMAAGSNLLGLGQQNINSGTNFFNTLLNGNQANTTALLQPNINQIQQAQQSALQAASTLQPRGGGRSATLFSQPFAANQQIQNLFNGARTQAATTLPQIGAQEQSLGANLYGIGNTALNTAGQGGYNLGQLGQQQQQLTNSMWSGLGSGLFGLATTPFGGGGAAHGLLGLI